MSSCAGSDVPLRLCDWVTGSSGAGCGSDILESNDVAEGGLSEIDGLWRETRRAMTKTQYVPKRGMSQSHDVVTSHAYRRDASRPLRCCTDPKQE